MLVRALLLRHLGAKIDPVTLRANLPMVGVLTLDRSPYDGRDGRATNVCRLTASEGSNSTLVELFNARVLKIECRGLLIAGEEDHWNRKRKTTYPQAMWAWPFHGRSEAAGIFHTALRRRGRHIPRSVGGANLVETASIDRCTDIHRFFHCI